MVVVRPIGGKDRGQRDEQANKRPGAEKQRPDGLEAEDRQASRRDLRDRQIRGQRPERQTDPELVQANTKGGCSGSDR